MTESNESKDRFLRALGRLVWDYPGWSLTSIVTVVSLVGGLVWWVSQKVQPPPGVREIAAIERAYNKLGLQRPAKQDLPGQIDTLWSKLLDGQSVHTGQNPVYFEKLGEFSPRLEEGRRIRTPWKKPEWFKGGPASVDVGPGKGEDGAWSVAGPIEGFSEENDFPVTGLRMEVAPNLKSAEIATAWAYVENNEATRALELKGGIIGQVSQETGLVALVGPPRTLVPGEWVLLYWLRSNTVKIKNADGRTEKITTPGSLESLDVVFKVESNGSYSGRFLFTDVSLYRIKDST